MNKQFFILRRFQSGEPARGFTLIETLAAISLLMIAIVAPMSLATQALSAAYYARDQITAFYLAQEGIEVARSVRDANILAIAEGNSGVNIFDGICPSGGCPASGYTFMVDSTVAPAQAIQECPNPGGVPTCPPIQTDGTVYGYDNYSYDWTNTEFTRTVTAELVNADNPDELRIISTVTWKQGSYQTRSFTLEEDLYRWVEDASGA